MEYSEIYNICQPIIDWLKENYPHNHKIIIDTSSAELIECSKMLVLDKKLSNVISNSYSPKGYEKEMHDILNIDPIQIQDDGHRFGVEVMQKLFNYTNQPEPKKNDSEEMEHD